MIRGGADREGHAADDNYPSNEFLHNIHALGIRGNTIAAAATGDEEVHIDEQPDIMQFRVLCSVRANESLGSYYGLVSVAFRDCEKNSKREHYPHFALLVIFT